MLNKTPLAINERDPNLTAWLLEWTRNRDFVEGERKVMPGTAAYPQLSPYLTPDTSLDADQNRKIAGITPFFPAASIVHGGLLGLMFRRKAAVTCPAAALDILNTITADGFTIDDLAESVTSEVLTTNFCGLLTDYPTAPSGLTKAQAISQGYRPFIGMYPAESILGIETGVINSRQRAIRVRLQEDDETIRELRVDAGVYHVVIWRSNGGQWSPTESYQPTINGKTFDEMPFTLISTQKKFAPSKSPITDVALLNQQHLAASSNLAVADFWVSRPVPYIFGAGATKDDTISIAPGIIWRNEDPSTKAGMVEYTGSSILQLKTRVDDLELKMSKTLGGNVLQNDKAASEAAETLAIRKNTDHATIASIARMTSRGINDQLKWVAWWLDLAEGDISYFINTDYNASPLNNLDIDARRELVTGGVISKDALIDILIEHEVLPETFDREADAEKIKQEIADAPTVELPRSGDNLGTEYPAKSE